MLEGWPGQEFGSPTTNERGIIIIILTGMTSLARIGPSLLDEFNLEMDDIFVNVPVFKGAAYLDKELLRMQQISLTCLLPSFAIFFISASWKNKTKQKQMQLMGHRFCRLTVLTNLKLTGSCVFFSGGSCNQSNSTSMPWLNLTTSVSQLHELFTQTCTFVWKK